MVKLCWNVCTTWKHAIFCNWKIVNYHLVRLWSINIDIDMHCIDIDTETYYLLSKDALVTWMKNKYTWLQLWSQSFPLKSAWIVLHLLWVASKRTRHLKSFQKHGSINEIGQYCYCYQLHFFSRLWSFAINLTVFKLIENHFQYTSTFNCERW